MNFSSNLTDARAAFRIGEPATSPKGEVKGAGEGFFPTACPQNYPQIGGIVELMQMLQFFVTLAGVAVIAIWTSVTIWALWALRGTSTSSWLDAPVHIQPLPSYSKKAGRWDEDREPIGGPELAEALAHPERPKPAPRSPTTAQAARKDGRPPCPICSRVRAFFKR